MVMLFFFNDTATTEIYTLSLHDALPISPDRRRRPARAAEPPDHRVLLAPGGGHGRARAPRRELVHVRHLGDRKSTRLNSSHANISYAVFCLKKNKTKTI